MGNRAVIVPKESVGDHGPVVGIYVHWFFEDALAEALEEVEKLG